MGPMEVSCDREKPGTEPKLGPIRGYRVPSDYKVVVGPRFPRPF